MSDDNKVKVRMLKSLSTIEGAALKKGDIADWPEEDAKRLVESGYMEYVKSDEEIFVDLAKKLGYGIFYTHEHQNDQDSVVSHFAHKAGVSFKHANAPKE